jgi:hypothetical protein
MRQSTPTIRLAALMAPAALVVHELRYLLGFGDNAGEALAARGHSYLPLAGGLAVLLLALGAGQLLSALNRARRSAQSEPAPRFLVCWLAVSASLVVVYSSQELTESLLSPGHRLAVEVVLGQGGWSAIPLAALVGGVVAFVLRLASKAVAYVAARFARPRHRPAASARRPGREPARALAAPLARYLASRAPPPRAAT